MLILAGYDPPSTNTIRTMHRKAFPIISALSLDCAAVHQNWPRRRRGYNLRNRVLTCPSYTAFTKNDRPMYAFSRFQ